MGLPSRITIRSSGAASGSCTDQLLVLGTAFHCSAGGRSRGTEPTQTRSSFQAERVIGCRSVPGFLSAACAFFWSTNNSAARTWPASRNKNINPTVICFIAFLCVLNALRFASSPFELFSLSLWCVSVSDEKCRSHP